MSLYYSLEDGKPFPEMGPDWAHQEKLMPAYDHPNGGAYETQEDRFGSSRSSSRAHDPDVEAERSFTFNEDKIKAILSDYVNRRYGMNSSVKDVRGDYREADYRSPFDSSPGYCKFTVTVKC